MSHLPASIFQISRSDAWNLTLSPDAARNMRDLAAQIGAGMPKYLIAPEVSLLLSYIDDLNIRMYFETLWNTGARLNEALALKPADFMLTPTRQYPQPVVILKTLKQRLKEAERRPGRPTTRHPPLHPDPRYRKPPEPAVRLVPVLMPDTHCVCGNTWRPGKSGSNISLCGT